MGGSLPRYVTKLAPARIARLITARQAGHVFFLEVAGGARGPTWAAPGSWRAAVNAVAFGLLAYPRPSRPTLRPQDPT
jgi:hypothetical protein